MDTLELRIDNDVPNRKQAERLVRRYVDRLERHCDHITSCRVAVEKPNAHLSSGADFRVRVDVRVAGAEPVVVRREPGEGSVRDGLEDVIRDVFSAADRRLEELGARQNGRVKLHPEQSLQGVIDELRKDYGFIVTTDDRQVYFHSNSVHGTEFAGLAVGMGVAFTERVGNEGPQASTVRVVDGRSGARSIPSDLLR